MEQIKQKITTAYFIENYKKFFPYIKPYLSKVILAIILSIPVGLMDAVIAWALKPYMDVVMLEKQTTSVSLLPLLIILFSLIQGCFNYLSTYLNVWVSKRITFDLKIKLFNKLMLFDTRYFDKKTSGQVIQRFDKDAETASNGLIANLKTFTSMFFSTIGLICVLLWNSWILAVVAIIIFLIALIPLTTVRRNLKQIMKQALETESAVLTHYNETYNGNKIIKSFNLYKLRDSLFQKTLNNVFHLSLQMTRKTKMISPLMHVIAAIGIALVIWIGSFLISNHFITIGNFVSFIAALLMLYTPLKSIGNNYTDLQKAFIAMERVFKNLETISKIKQIENPIEINSITKGISFNNVFFGYEKDKTILKNISFTIKKGEVVAFVGNSGGGKSTLANLLLRFYDIKEGSICIDDINIKNIDINNLRDNIAIVLQGNFLFSGTIRENIIIGNINATTEQINKAIKDSCLEEFISSLELGLDTQIGEKGVLLSGGQKQRIAIARAFIKNAPIVILDEATSALDTKSEKIVQQAIYNLMEDRTVLIIAHRLSTIKNANKIIVIDHGEIKESGTHEELINNKNSIYSNLYKNN